MSLHRQIVIYLFRKPRQQSVRGGGAKVDSDGKQGLSSCPKCNSTPYIVARLDVTVIYHFSSLSELNRCR